MVLYHAITVYHLLKFSIHKLRFHKDESAIILIPSFLVRKLESFNGALIFDKVTYFSWERLSDKKSVFSEITEFLYEHGINDLSVDVSEINVASAAYYFGSYLVENGISFNWFEEADGRFTNPEPIMADDKRLSIERYDLACKYGLYSGDNKCVKKIYVKYESQRELHYQQNLVDFDVNKELDKLNKDEIDMILKFFNAPKIIDNSRSKALMLTQHFCNLRTLSYMDHVLMYKSTMDYYLDGIHTIFKWHPSDYMSYSTFIDDIEMISGDFPSELLRFICSEKFKIIASISSTGILNLQGLCEKQLFFGEEYIHGYKKNEEYYFLCKLINLLPKYHINLLGINTKQLHNMMEFGVDDTLDIDFGECTHENMTPSMVIIGGFIEKSECIDAINTLSTDDVIVCIEEKNVDLLLSSLPKNNKQDCFFTKEICFDPINQKAKGDRYVKHIYFISKNPKIRKRIMNMEYTKILKNLGIKSEVKISDEKDMEIEALKGMLKAAENELLRYKNAEYDINNKKVTK